MSDNPNFQVPPQQYSQPLPMPPAQPPRKKIWVWVLVVSLVFVLFLCPLATCGTLYFVGSSYQSKTQTLIASAPADGSEAVFHGIVGSTNSIGAMNVGLSRASAQMDIIVVPLQSNWDYTVDGSSVSMKEFYAAAVAGGREPCDVTYTREGIVAMDLNPVLN
jgi:hypothetical protein